MNNILIIILLLNFLNYFDVNIMQNTLVKDVRRIFPELHWGKTKFISSGWDHDILMLDDRYVVRIPKNNDAKKRITIDFCLLKYLQSKISANIPIPIVKDIKSKIAIYSVVPGIIMSETKYKKLTIIKKNSFAKKIALFLSEIHSCSISKAHNCGIPKTDTDKKNNEVFNNIKFIERFISQGEKNAIDKFVKKRKSLLTDFSPVLIHGDLTSDNIFISNHNKNNLGIIDFSDAVIDDPARDLAALFSYGEKFVKSVLRFYNKTLAKQLFERAQIYHQETAIVLLAFKRSKYISKKDAKSLFLQRFKIKRV